MRHGTRTRDKGQGHRGMVKEKGGTDIKAQTRKLLQGDMTWVIKQEIKDRNRKTTKQKTEKFHIYRDKGT